MRKYLGAIVIAAATVAGPLQAGDLPELDRESHIMRSLLSAAVSLGVSRSCPTMEIRQVYGLFKALELRNYARRLGYSDEEINAFVNDPVEQKRMEEWAWAYMQEQGVKKNDPESHCSLGKYEIERGSLSGRLLRDLDRTTN